MFKQIEELFYQLVDQKIGSNIITITITVDKLSVQKMHYMLIEYFKEKGSYIIDASDMIVSETITCHFPNGCILEITSHDKIETVDVVLRETYRDGGTQMFEDKYGRQYYRAWRTKKWYPEYPFKHGGSMSDEPHPTMKEITCNINIVESFK